MSFTLRKATLDDAHDLVDIYLSAFAVDAISLLCFPRNNQASYHFWYNMIIDEMADPNSHYLVIVPASPGDSPESAPPSSKPIAFAKWNSPSTPMSTDLPTWPHGSDVPLANHFFGELVTRHKKIMTGRPHWYLELVATRPGWQGKGAAGMLMRWGLERADREGTESYLEASPDGKPIYEHFGFEEVERLVVDLVGKKGIPEEREFVEVMMVRPVMSKT
jgi:GNAT superfamily N-acetyltransferase